jgi:hypothetical protein
MRERYIWHMREALEESCTIFAGSEVTMEVNTLESNLFPPTTPKLKEDPQKFVDDSGSFSSS